MSQNLRRDYDFAAVEQKWQRRWEETGAFRAEDRTDRPKFYCLVEFPYPSGDGLHVGHPRSYTAIDILARKRRMQGYNVLYPMGFDSFGLPTENHAIKTGIHPSIVTQRNIARFTAQLKALGFSFDWDRAFSTTDPEYYRWTQWIFLKLFERGLAYKAKMPINWCLSCKIGLANEEVVDGCCERCGGAVEKRNLEQWMLRITAYADRLIADLDEVEFLEKIKTQQINWIGRSEGANVDFALAAGEARIRVYTTRPDTLFGATYMVLAPEHELVEQITTPAQRAAVEAYRHEVARRSDLERTESGVDKTGVFTGAYALNPVNGEQIPIWLADYVLQGYGTGAIMAVPAHDARDFAFATKFALPIRCILRPDPAAARAAGVDVAEVLAGRACWPGEGVAINSANADGLGLDGTSVAEAFRLTVAWLEARGIGQGAVNYKLRDWVFSRQRYWGEPIPMVHCPDCGWVPLPEDELPLLLPEVARYEPTETGESPLAAVTDWVNTACPKCGGPGRRETDTMPNWAGSSWYFLRYCDPGNDRAFADPERLRYWMPVDWYNGGMEHTTLHLLYSRFWNKFLHQCGLVPTSEPYQKRTSHGMILGESGEKMSKSRGNVINPDEVISIHGADVFRVYEMFLGPFDQAAAWDTQGIVGIDRFLRKVWRMIAEGEIIDTPPEPAARRLLHQAIKKVGEDIETLDLNTAISQMMICANEFAKCERLPREIAESFTQILAPFAPHLAEELWELLGHAAGLTRAPWPEFDPACLVVAEVEVLVQWCGKPLTRMTMPAAADQAQMAELALANPVVREALAGKAVRKVVAVPGRLVNLVA